MTETSAVTISLANLLAGASLVPPANRATFLATLLVGADALHSLTEGMPTAPANVLDENDGAPASVSLTPSQARKLKEKVDPATWEVIRAAVSNVTDGVALVDWSNVKKLTGVPNWTVFAKGRLGGLNRALRKIEGVPANAVLLWEGDGWAEDGKGDYSAGALGIDGPVVRTLQMVMGIGND